MTADVASGKGAPGRPRRDGTTSRNQRAEILEAAVRLFKKNGYTKTSMSAIARESGLGQSSVYYWFSCKDEILKELLATNKDPVAAAEQARDEGRSVPEQLHAMLYQDTKALCELPFDYRLLETAAHRGGEDFSAFFEDYASLVGKAEELIAEGVANGDFQCSDPHACAVAVVAADEGAQHRYHNQEWSAPEGFVPLSAEQMAAATASLSVRGLRRAADEGR